MQEIRQLFGFFIAIFFVITFYKYFYFVYAMMEFNCWIVTMISLMVMRASFDGYESVIFLYSLFFYRSNNSRVILKFQHIFKSLIAFSNKTKLNLCNKFSIFFKVSLFYLPHILSINRKIMIINSLWANLD